MIDSDLWDAAYRAREAEMAHREKRVEAMIGRLEAVARTPPKRPGKWSYIAIGVVLASMLWTCGMSTATAVGGYRKGLTDAQRDAALSDYMARTSARLNRSAKHIKALEAKAKR